MKDWTPENQADLVNLSKEVSDRLPGEIAKIREENGLPPNGPGVVCTKCRKMVQSDEDGNWYCECHDERVGWPL